MKVRNLKWLFLTSSLLIVLMLASCKPAATPMPTLLPSPVSPQQIAPAATREVAPSPVATSAVSPAVATSGLRITAKVGPACPGPQRAGQVCEGPYEGEFIITTSSGAEAGRVKTDQNGQATIELQPDRYTVAPKIEGRLPRGAPVDVAVPPGQVVDVNIALDSGIR